MIKTSDMERNAYAVIMAGGRGTRFWPLSRSQRPKQLLEILGRKSLILQTAERIRPLFSWRNTLVVTVADHHRAVRAALPFIPRENFIVEPQGNNTAPCIGLAALELIERDPEAVMVMLPADHWVSQPQAFLRTLRAALRLAREQDALVTIGIRPSFPETGYGYILKGARIERIAGAPCFQVRGFEEKPALRRARALLRRGSLWNSGIFVWKAATILAMLSRFSPSIARGLERIRRARGAKRLEAIRREYRKMPNISIDYAVLEKAGTAGAVLTVEGDFGWSDVGNWAAVYRMLPHDRAGNAGVGTWLGYATKNCLIHSRARLVALLGVDGLVVVDTPDALLVADMARSQEVRELVEELIRRGYGRYTVR